MESFFVKFQDTVDNCFGMKEMYHKFTRKFPKVLLELLFISALGGYF